MRSIQFVRTLPLVAVLIAALAASAGGCGDDDNNPNNTGGTGGSGAVGGTGGVGGDGGTGGTGGKPDTPCEVDDDCQPFERCDEEQEICVPRCTRDSDCGRNTGLRCDMENGGVCIPGQPCDDDRNCGLNPEHGYCDPRRSPCACIPDQTMQQGDPPRNGVCWRNSSVCDECADDVECGENSRCVPYSHEGETKNVCLRRPNTSGVCGPGTLPADVPDNDPLAGLCVPQFGDCGTFRPCRDDSDCDQMNPVCDRKRQICIPGCNFDYESNRSQGCPPERVCHATKEGTDPRLLDDCATAHLWGVGTCAPPCESDDECKVNGDNWTCKTYGQERRCVPIDKDDDQACLSDHECVNSAVGSEVKGFCDVRTYSCNLDSCRMGLDPFVGCTKNYEDCTSQFKCVMDPETEDRFVGMCYPKDCIDKGGAETGCGFAEFCANEEFRDMFTGEKLSDKRTPVPSGVSSGECYPMDVGAWCNEGCQGHQDCAGVTVTNYPDLPHLCVEPAQGYTVCAPACKYNQDCPSAWRCEAQGKLTCSDNLVDSFKFCEDDVDCGGRGKCVTPKVGGVDYRFPSNMEPWKVCTCDPSQANACGSSEFVCNAGIGTAKEDDSQILENYCTKPGNCGAKGSCEFMGDIVSEDPENPDAPLHPVFFCANDGGILDGVQASCPPTHVKGQSRGDRFYCITSQVCVPWLNEDDVCGVPTGQ